MKPNIGTPEQEARRDALVRWLVTGELPKDSLNATPIAGFSMIDWREHRPCGTVVCMALLGININDGRELFMPTFPGAMRTEDRLWVARVFQNWRETGVVDWAGMQ